MRVVCKTLKYWAKRQHKTSLTEKCWARNGHSTFCTFQKLQFHRQNTSGIFQINNNCTQLEVQVQNHNGSYCGFIRVLGSLDEHFANAYWLAAVTQSKLHGFTFCHKNKHTPTRFKANQHCLNYTNAVRITLSQFELHQHGSNVPQNAVGICSSMCGAEVWGNSIHSEGCSPGSGWCLWLVLTRLSRQPTVQLSDQYSVPTVHWNRIDHLTLPSN